MTWLHADEAMRVTDTIVEGSNEEWRICGFDVNDRRDQTVQLSSMFHYGRSVPPGRYTRLLRLYPEGRSKLVMSDTPDELRDVSYLFYQVQRREAERIIVNGLGMGCVVKGLLELDHVKSIDVVEISQPLVDLMSKAAPWMSDPRVHVHVADAFEMKWLVGTRWDVAWHDVWDDMCEDNLPRYGRLNRMYGGRVEYQEAWGHELVKYERQRSNRGWW